MDDELTAKEAELTTKEIDRLIDWLKSKGFTTEQTAECIKYIAME